MILGSKPKSKLYISYFLIYTSCMYLSVIIPAYNEEKRISATLDHITEYLSRQSYDWEIIVVNNASTDDTGALVKYRQNGMPNLRIIDEARKGKGYAVTRGMLEANGELRLFMDADNSTTIDHIERMMPYIREGYSVVIGSLTEPGAQIVSGGEEPLWKVLFGKLGNKWIQLFAVWGINDTQRGFKIFTALAAKDIFPRLTIFGWGLDVEVLTIARLKRHKIKEIPITWNNDPDSKVNIWAYPQVLLHTLVVFRNRLLGIYKKDKP
jgi:dolichyl-phosphate beta-glucosyltransferase